MSCDLFQDHFDHFTDFDSWESDGIHELACRQDMLFKRIKKVLSGKSNSQIKILIKIVDSIMQDYFSVDNEWSRIEKRHITGSKEYRQLNESRNDQYGPFVASYLLFIDEYELSPKITWPEVFAILALNSLGEAITRSLYQNSREFQMGPYAKDYMKLHDEARALFEGVDLIGVADRLLENKNTFKDELSKAVSEEIRLKNRRGGIQKNAPIKIVKGRFISWYYKNIDKGIFQSKSDAARKFYANLAKEESALMAPTNAVRTLKDALRTHEKALNESS